MSGSRGVVALLSGGLDSTGLIAWLDAEGYRPIVAASVNYGQRHVREIDAAREVCARYDIEQVRVDLRAIAGLLTGSSLTDDVAVPDGHYQELTMRATVVPNRNLIMLSVAAGLAVARGLPFVATAVHGGDHFIYPDCRPHFIGAAAAAIHAGTDTFGPGGAGITLLAPFVNKDKAHIARVAHDLGAPIDVTWSCYKGRDIHCGTCGTCWERQEAFLLAGVPDPTEYAAVPDPIARLAAAVRSA